MIYQKQGGLTVKTTMHLGEVFSRGNCIVNQLGNYKKPIEHPNQYAIEIGDFILHIVRCACRFRVSIYNVVKTSSKHAEVVEIPASRIHEFPLIAPVVEEMKDHLCQAPRKNIS